MQRPNFRAANALLFQRVTKLHTRLETIRDKLQRVRNEVLPGVFKGAIQGNDYHYAGNGRQNQSRKLAKRI